MGLIRSGDLDRCVRVERPVDDDASDGAGSSTWEPVAEVWAQVQDTLPSRGEQQTDGLPIANRPARVRMRFRADVTAKMRIVMGARVMQIITVPAEIGRREGLEMMVVDFSTAGGGV